MLSSEITSSINNVSGIGEANSFNADLELYVKKSKQYLADAARKAAQASSNDDPNGNKRDLKLDICDPLTYWVVQVS